MNNLVLSDKMNKLELHMAVYSNMKILSLLLTRQ